MSFRSVARELAAYDRGLEDGKAQGWQECEKAHEDLKQRLIEKQRELAETETRARIQAEQAEAHHRSVIELVHAAAFNEGQAFALYGNRAWMVETEGKRAS